MTTEQEMEDNANEEFLHMMAVGEDFLEHHGVKGMKWGVRRAARTETRISRLERVGAGKGSTGDKIKTVSTATGFSLARKHGSVQKEAASRATVLRARQARIANNTASRADKRLKNSTNAQTAVDPLNSLKKKFTPENKKLKVNKSDHPVTKKVKQDHNNLSDHAFILKYGVNKAVYRKRVAKNKDPFAARATKAASKNN